MILADHITFDGDTAWWVTESLAVRWMNPINTLTELSRPCDRCYGDRTILVVNQGEEPCPARCIDGRHTFDIEVDDGGWPGGEWGPDPRPLTYRVSIVPGMVLPIVDRRMQPTTPTGPVILLGFNGPSIWTESTGHRPVALPPAAKPGMWAVQLKVAK